MGPKDEKKDQDLNKNNVATETPQDELMCIYHLKFEEIPLKNYYYAQSKRKR